MLIKNKKALIKTALIKTALSKPAKFVAELTYAEINLFLPCIILFSQS